MTPTEFGLTQTVYDTAEVLDVLRCHRTKLYELIDAGILRPSKLGKKNLFMAPDVAACLTALRDGAMARTTEAA